MMIFMRRFLSFSVALVGAAWLFLAPVTPAQASILITIDKAAQKMTVDVDGATRWIWPVSTGRRGYDTPAGSFRPFRLEEDHYSKEWDDAPMPYSIFFTGEGHAIHGSYETRNLGRPVSHGCVRIAPKNAEKLFTLVQREGLEKARVVVREEPNAPLVSRRRAPAQEASTAQQARKPVPNLPAPTAVLPPAQAPAYTPQQAYGYVPAQPTAAPDFSRPPLDLPRASAPAPARTAVPGLY
jgi:L,D-transpeptidase catalytic domain